MRVRHARPHREPTVSCEVCEDPMAGVAGDDTLFESVFSQSSALEARVWINARCLVAPRSWRGEARCEQAAALSAKRGWPVAFRASGGSCVPHDHNVLNLSLCQSGLSEALPSPDDAYRQLCGVLARALSVLGLTSYPSSVPGALCDGSWNVCVDGRKIAGLSQRRRLLPDCGCVLTHASLFISPMEQGLRAAAAFLSECDRESVVRRAAHCSVSEVMKINLKGSDNLQGLVRDLLVDALRDEIDDVKGSMGTG